MRGGHTACPQIHTQSADRLCTAWRGRVLVIWNAQRNQTRCFGSTETQKYGNRTFNLSSHALLSRDSLLPRQS